jgi:chromosome segregation protein
MIDAILSDRTDDRRFLFEEASGISKYKNRKKAALRKLEATDGDLIRLKDIVAEVNTQVNSLNRQMNKAQRYKKYSDELKGWEIFFGKTLIDSLNRENRELSSERETLSDNKIKSETNIDTISAEQEAERKKLTDIEKQLSEISNDIYKKSEEAHTIEKEISVLHERHENAQQLREKNILDIDAYDKRKKVLLEQIDQSEKETVDCSNDLTRLEKEYVEKEKVLLSIDENLLTTRQEREKFNQKLMALEGQLSAGKSDDHNLKEQETEINSGLTNLDRQLETLGNENNILREKQTECENKISLLKEKINDAESKRTAIENEIASLDKQHEETAGMVYELSSSLEAAQARNHLLKEMIAHFEGYGGGVVTAMENRERWPGLIGTVADNLTPKPGFENPIEAALGDTASFMICHDRATAEGIIEFLKREAKGKASILIMEHAGSNSLSTRPQIVDEGLIGWADNYVSVSGELTMLASLLLSTVAIVKPDRINDILDKLPYYFSAVTTDGKFFRGKAIMSGGSQEGLSLLGRKEKVAEQDRVIGELASQTEELKNKKNHITTLIGSRQAELKELIAELDDLRNDSDNTEKEFTSHSFERQATQKEISRIENERRELSARLESLRNRQYSLNLNHDQLAKEKNSIIESLREHDAKFEKLENESEKLENLLSSLQISRVELKSKRQQLESQIRHTKELIDEINLNTTQKSEEIDRADQEIIGYEEKNILLENELKKKFDSRDAMIENQREVKKSHDAIQNNLDIREKEIKSLRQSREEINTELHATEIRIAEIESEIRNIKQNIRDEHDIDLEEITAEPPNVEIAVEERPARILQLKERMKDFGAVNLLALDEYKTAKERQEFLTSQINDLLNAKTTLQSTIVKINQTAKKLFIETFDKVRSNFQEVFAELFTGGESNIRLLNENDPLESPIEIIARPRGKKLLSITQMSGGERALTAISLLFAIYLAKPSPFCILDEIDAPLDDANIHRFLKIIKTFSDQTQFIIITHNKISMEAADILYGITMEQPGVSRVVSVRFNESGSEKIIDTSIGDIELRHDSEIPTAVKDRITPTVNIKSTDSTE